MTEELWKDLVCYSVQMENSFLFLIFLVFDKLTNLYKL